MWQSFAIAVGLMLIFEGILPFVAPGMWRNVFRSITELRDGQLRFLGLTSMIIGLLFIIIIRFLGN